MAVCQCKHTNNAPFCDGTHKCYEIPIPATYIVDTNGLIVHAFVDADYTKRMEPDDIVAILEKMKGEDE